MPCHQKTLSFGHWFGSGQVTLIYCSYKIYLSEKYNSDMSYDLNMAKLEMNSSIGHQRNHNDDITTFFSLSKFQKCRRNPQKIGVRSVVAYNCI